MTVAPAFSYACGPTKDEAPLAQSRTIFNPLSGVETDASKWFT